jgi:fatty acid omega-hydroxylase
MMTRALIVKVRIVISRHGLKLVAVLLLVIREVVRRRQARPRGATILPGHWLMGCLPESIRAAAQKTHLEHQLQQHRQFGRTFAHKNAFSTWKIQTTRPENLEHILKTNFDNYPKGKFFRDRLQDLLGGGIFNADGNEWHTQRRVVSHMFTANLFKEHIWVVVRRNARKLRDILEGSGPDQIVDVFSLMNRYTLDSIGEIGFGCCIGSLEDPSSPFLLSFDRAQQIAFWRFLMDSFWPVFKLLQIGPEKESRTHFGRLDSYSREVVRDLCAAINAAPSKNGGVAWADIEARKSFVGLFIEDARKRGESLSEDYLRDLVMNFLFAGRDPTAQALSWTIYCLCLHPEVEDKARQEIVDVCGVRGPAYEDLPRLTYLQAVISEVLRLYPSIPIDIKTAVSDDTWPDGTFIPAGSTVAYDIYSMGRDEAIWGENAEVFRPERWLEMKRIPGNSTYPVFNAGPRECPGRRMAEIEMKTCLAMLLPQVSFRLAVPASEISTNSQITIGMGNGLPCVVVSTAKRSRLGSNTSTTARSESEVAASELTHASSEFDPSEEEILTACQSESSAHSETEPTPGALGEDDDDGRISAGSDNLVTPVVQEFRRRHRTRTKKQKSGWTRQRQSRFWDKVRESTPERWPSFESKYSDCVDLNMRLRIL